MTAGPSGQRAAQPRPRHLAVRRPRRARQPLAAARPAPAATRAATTAVGSGGHVERHLGPGHREHLDLQVHPVQQRPGQPAQVAPPGQRRARALVALRRSAIPHGQGLAASTSWNRAGNRSAPWRPVDHQLALLQRLPQRVQRPRARTRGASSRNSTPRWAREAAPGPRQPGPAADERRRGRGVVRVLERRPAQQARRPGRACPRRECTAVTSSACSSLEVGQQPGQPGGEHRLARARRPEQQQVVAARRGDLEACRASAWPTTSARSSRSPRAGRCPAPRRCRTAGHRPRRPAASVRRSARRGAAATTSASDRTATTSTPGTSRASAAFAAGTTTRGRPARTAASTAGRTPRTGCTRPSSPSSPRCTRAAHGRRVDRARWPRAGRRRRPGRTRCRSSAARRATGSP